MYVCVCTCVYICVYMCVCYNLPSKLISGANYMLHTLFSVTNYGMLVSKKVMVQFMDKNRKFVASAEIRSEFFVSVFYARNEYIAQHIFSIYF